MLGFLSLTDLEQMKRFKVGQTIEYSGYKWIIHSIIWIRDNNGKAKKLRIMSTSGKIIYTWDYICFNFSNCEININKLK